MSFIETPRFPTAISFGSSGGPLFDTSVIILSSGFEQRNANWSEPLRQWDVSQGIKTEADMNTLLLFFVAMQARTHGFRFKDFTDFKSVSPEVAVGFNDQNLGTGDAAKTVFQIIKNYITGSLTQVKTIKKTVTGTVRVALDAVEQFSGFTVDNNLGTITFSVAPGVGVVVGAGYEYDVPVRFDMDRLEISLTAFNARELPAMPVREIRL